MIKTWVLIFALISFQDTITTHAEKLDNKTACEAAAEKLKSFAELHVIFASCVPVYPNQNETLSESK